MKKVLFINLSDNNDAEVFFKGPKNMSIHKIVMKLDSNNLEYFQRQLAYGLGKHKPEELIIITEKNNKLREKVYLLILKNIFQN